TAFISLDSWPRNPAGAIYTIEEQTGKMTLDQRQHGNGSAYGRITPVMNELAESELIIRFRVHELGKNKRIRFWIQADTFSSGRSMPVNGYGAELHLGTDQLTLLCRNDRASTNLDRIPLNMTTDWHWLKLCMRGVEISVRLWMVEVEEMAVCDMFYCVYKITRLVGKLSL